MHFRGRDIASSTWCVSCLLVTKEADPGNLVYRVGPLAPATAVPATHLASFAGYHFFQYYMYCRLSSEVAPSDYTSFENPHAVEYSFEQEHKLNVGAHRFYMPREGEDAEANMLFFSCNGVQRATDLAKMADFDNTWRHAMSRHTNESPIHAAFCGGDYVYCDSVLRLPIIQSWNNLPDDQRFSAPFTEAMREEVMLEYFNRYVSAFMDLPDMAAFQACVPIGCVPDDHDYFDGKGSHTAMYNECPVYKGISECATYFILLFQYGANPTTIASSRPPCIHGVDSYSLVHVISPRTVVLSLDHRSERLINEADPQSSILMTEDSESLVFAALEHNIPQGCAHLIVSVFGPIAYSQTVVLEKAMDGFASVEHNVLFKNMLEYAGKKVHGLTGPQHTVDLKDDIYDEYGSKYYCTARNKFLTKLRKIADSRSLRITFVCGDVHLGGFGYLYHDRPDYSDPSYCRQWITSPMSNISVPESLIQFINMTSYMDYSPDKKRIHYHDPSVPAHTPRVLYYSALDHTIMGHMRAVRNLRNFLLVKENSRTRGLTGRLLFEKYSQETGYAFKLYTDEVWPVVQV